MFQVQWEKYDPLFACCGVGVLASREKALSQVHTTKKVTQVI